MPFNVSTLVLCQQELGCDAIVNHSRAACVSLPSGVDACLCLDFYGFNPDGCNGEASCVQGPRACDGLGWQHYAHYVGFAGLNSAVLIAALVTSLLFTGLGLKSQARSFRCAARCWASWTGQLRPTGEGARCISLFTALLAALSLFGWNTLLSLSVLARSEPGYLERGTWSKLLFILASASKGLLFLTLLLVSLVFTESLASQRGIQDPDTTGCVRKGNRCFVVVAAGGYAGALAANAVFVSRDEISTACLVPLLLAITIEFLVGQTIAGLIQPNGKLERFPWRANEAGSGIRAGKSLGGTHCGKPTSFGFVFWTFVAFCGASLDVAYEFYLKRDNPYEFGWAQFAGKFAFIHGSGQVLLVATIHLGKLKLSNTGGISPSASVAPSAAVMKEAWAPSTFSTETKEELREAETTSLQRISSPLGADEQAKRTGSGRRASTRMRESKFRSSGSLGVVAVVAGPNAEDDEQDERIYPDTSSGESVDTDNLEDETDEDGDEDDHQKESDEKDEKVDTKDDDDDDDDDFDTLTPLPSDALLKPEFKPPPREREQSFSELVGDGHIVL